MVSSNSSSSRRGHCWRVVCTWLAACCPPNPYWAASSTKYWNLHLQFPFQALCYGSGKCSCTRISIMPDSMVLHRFIRLISTWALSSFFTEVRVIGGENVPKDGPIIVYVDILLQHLGRPCRQSHVLQNHESSIISGYLQDSDAP